ncbi:hypothetical protein LZC95_19460 [Pendulispora brunnea]|uniref:Uncharacterized protein n=1 Tax=Pendulispora brunnea TaxID=2905690 RepID=A0ABZ2KJZ2_9BACT
MNFEANIMLLADGRRVALVSDFLGVEGQQALDTIDVTHIAPPRSARALLRKVDARDGTYRIVGWNLGPGIVDATEEVRSMEHPTTEITFRTTRVAG